MRKINPSDICDDFENEIESFIEFYEDGIKSLRSLSNSKSRISIFSELVFHRSYVALESFISAWFLGCINRDASRYLSFREQAILQSIKEKFDPWDATHISYSPPSHPSSSDISSLLDKEERNLTFKNFCMMSQRANDWLSESWSSKVNQITTERRAILDTAKTVRNCIAHQSRDSFREMNESILQLPTTGNASFLKREINSVKDVGAYLKVNQQGQSRINIFLKEFKEFGSDLKQ